MVDESIEKWATETHASENDKEMMYTLNEGRITIREAQFFRKFLEERDALADKERDEASQLLREARISLEKILDPSFSSDLTRYYTEAQQSTFVIKSDQFDRVLADFKATTTRSNPEGYGASAAFDPISEAILIPEDQLSRQALYEEFAHGFLNLIHRRENQGSNDLMRKVGKYGKIRQRNRDMLAHVDSNKEVATIELDLSDPEEQIVKALVVSMMKQNNEALTDHLYLRVAQKGQERIDEIGWSQIRRGEYTTNHEESYIVRLHDDDKTRLRLND